MIVEFANQLREHGRVFNAAIKEAAIARFRPIIIIRFWLSALLLLSLTTSAFGRQTETLDTGRVTASIISSLDRVAPGGTVWVALRTELDEGWHTYWRNPGEWRAGAIDVETPARCRPRADRLASAQSDPDGSYCELWF